MANGIGKENMNFDGWSTKDLNESAKQTLWDNMETHEKRERKKVNEEERSMYWMKMCKMTQKNLTNMRLW